jgi:hypothetical protein
VDGLRLRRSAEGPRENASARRVLVVLLGPLELVEISKAEFGVLGARREKRIFYLTLF